MEIATLILDLWRNIKGFFFNEDGMIDKTSNRFCCHPIFNGGDWVFVLSHIFLLSITIYPVDWTPISVI